ncbi:MAG: tRNA-dihydrouridine synthase family protein [Candidatus Heimdallarchaeota archaeon]|nr:tRNA-dihydrouridine synthase family protein [Candidatus Heimdallarchaeota archaeon]
MQYMLAPIEKLIDPSYRSILHKYGADHTFSELIRFELLAKGKPSALKRIRIEDGTPSHLQFMGTKEPLLEKFLSNYDPKPGFKGFNFNLGCPSQGYINSGLGSKMIGRPTKVARMVDIVKDHGFPVSVKMRLGMTKQEKEDRIYLRLIDKVDADFFVLHARYRSQGYEIPADWTVFEEINRIYDNKNIVANGDIQSAEDVQRMKDLGMWGIMIGRPALINPLIFAELKGMRTPPVSQVWEEYLALVKGREPDYSQRLLEVQNMDLKTLKG